MKKLKNKSFFRNILMNVIAAGLLTAMTQLIIFPFVSRSLSIENFGIVVTLYGFKTMIVNFIGNTLNNIRLIYNDRISDKSNFTIILIISLCIASLFSVLLFSIYSSDSNVYEIIILVLLTVLSTFRIYLEVYFRLDFDYNKILILNAILITGYVIGLIIFTFYPYWWLIFLIGEIMAVIYLMKKTRILLEKPKITEEFPDLIKDTLHLMFSNGISTSLGYLDRFIIIPIVSAGAMSIYYSVSIFSKIINMLIVPFNNVLLSYLVRNKSHRSRYKFLKLNIGFISVLIPIYFFLNFITPYLLSVFYPQFLDEAINYIAIVNLGTIFRLLTILSNTFILKMHTMKYQVIIQLIYGATYLISALYLTINYGLLGFAQSTALSYFLNWVLLLLLGTFKKPTIEF